MSESNILPFIFIIIIILVIFIIWFFFGGQEEEFIGLRPLDPKTCSQYIQDGDKWIKIDPDQYYSCIAQTKDEKLDTILHTIDNEFIDIPSGNIDNQTPDRGNEIYETADKYMLDLESHGVVMTNDKICTIDEDEEKIIEVLKPTPMLTGGDIIKNVVPSGKFVSRGEKMCCEIMSKIYGKPFTTVRPPWLKNPETKRNLELDCYNQDLKIAVEYNGIQHYEWPNFTNQSREEFQNQVRRDELKVRLCDHYGVYLITVPYTVKLDQIEDYILKHIPEKINGF